MEDRLGLRERRAPRLPEERKARKVKPDRRAQLRQRLSQIAWGEADGNDADRLRPEPLLKRVGDRPPHAEGRSAHPTRARLENAGDARTLRGLLGESEEP
jgi:hypothetical protein